ncbi:unnamed protein product [Closterium sp. NIES-53]
MATPSVLDFDAEGRAVDFEVWVDDLQLFLQCDRADDLSLFDLTSGASPAPPATADSTVRSQWATCDAAARLALHATLPLPLLRLAASYCRTCYLTLLPFPQSLISLRTCALVTLATALRILQSSVPRPPPPPPMYITLYYIVTRLPDSLRVVKDHFLSVCPTTLTVDLLEQRLLAAETSIVARKAPRRQEQGGAGALVGLEEAVEEVMVAVVGVGVVLGVVAKVEVSAAAVEAEEAVVVAEGAEVAEVAEAAEAAVELVAALRRGVAPVAVSASSSSAVVRPRLPSSFVSGTLGVSEVGVLVPAPTFSVPATALVSMMRVTVTCVFLPDPGSGAAALGACEAAALGASASAAPGAGESPLSGTASAQVFHTFTLDSGASRSFFRDRTTLTPLRRPVAVSLADPSGGPVLASFSTELPCPAAPSGTLSGLYLPSFSTNLVSGADLQDQGVDQFTPASQRVAASGQVFAAASGSGPESAPCSCRLLSHQTLLCHHRLGHPSLPHLRGMASRVLVSGLPQSLPPLPPGPAPTCVPCVEGRQRAAPHSSEFPPTEAPLQTLHMDVWGPAHVRGQGHERYFLLVVDDYSRYTTVFPLRSKDDVTEPSVVHRASARLEHRTKQIALRYFLARELQQRGQLRLAYVASEANTANIFTKALPPGDHQRFCTMLGLVPTWPHLLTS